MSYDLAVWEGPHPADNSAAAEVYEDMCDRYQYDGLEPTDRIAAYVAALLKRWPDITEPDGELSPWATGPLIKEASGPLIYFPMSYRLHEEATAYAADVATSMGLVCYDPQEEQLRSSPR